ncbi:unnamed protein product [Rhizoctonia solani]|uniref:BTB domain-containing protein n=1 Tax=Rhizoctonia solani TaxID=456999 RepID=A0A8H3GFF6_9AGAM|nr:unnamed protein product [Rhizoctonia solani]
MDHDAAYTVTIRGREVLLTRSQIEFDSPNYFSICFLGDYKESQTRHLKLSRDPDLFLIISDHLCGYKVLPLNDRVLPQRMSPELALANLRIDAEFYQLDNLVKECDALLSRGNIKPKHRKNYLVLGCDYNYPLSSSISRQIDAAIGSPSCQWRTTVTAEKLTESPLAEMERPENHQGFSGLQLVSEIERYARKTMGFEPQLVGWHIERTTVTPFNTHALLMVVVEV